jgi:hypothetical protein
MQRLLSPDFIENFVCAEENKSSISGLLRNYTSPFYEKMRQLDSTSLLPVNNSIAPVTMKLGFGKYFLKPSSGPIQCF